MATLEDLGYTSILSMTQAEGVELIRQIRLSRRIPVVKPKKSTKKAKEKALPVVNADQARRLLEMIGKVK